MNNIKLTILLFALATGVYLSVVNDWDFSLALNPAEWDFTFGGSLYLFLGGLVGLFVLWKVARFVWENRGKSYEKQIRFLKKLSKKTQFSQGSADFANSAELKKMGLLGDKGFVLGKFYERFVRFSQPGHLITFAPTRSGKGVGHVIPNLLSHPGSVVVNDIKGENLAVTARFRSQFSKVVSFAPFDDESSCFNPLDFIRLGTDSELDDASLIVEMIILEEGSGDVFWVKEAKNLVLGLVLYVANESPPALKNLGEVRYLLMQGRKDFELTIKDMLRSKNPLVKRVASSVSATEPKVLASILSTAKSQTGVWDSPRLTAITSRSDFKLEDIKRDNISLYIVIPPEYLDVYKPVIRLMVGLTTAAMSRTKGQPPHPVLFLIDEFPALGYMKPIEQGIGYLAGYGVSLWMFIQDLSQLKDTYERWSTFISNCAVRIAFGTNDVETAKVLSEMLGTATIRVGSEGESSDAKRGLFGRKKTGVSTNYSETSRPLMTPDEVMRLPHDSQLIFIQGARPVAAEKIFYFKDPYFKGRFDRWDG